MTMPCAAQDGEKTVLVAGHVNHDRVWKLGAPLVAGQRQKWLSRTVQIGGGGWFTGARLAALGRKVELVAPLARDARGQETAARLHAQGFDTTNLDRSAAKTHLTEILLDPDGERTILAAPGPVPVFDLRVPPKNPVAAYLNIQIAGPGLIGCLAAMPLVLVQLPLTPRHPITGDLAVTSRADFPDLSLRDILARARACCGPRLRALIVTDGAGPVQVLRADGTTHVVPVAAPLELHNSIGAGDSFAGCLLHALLDGYALVAAVERANGLVRDWLARQLREGADHDVHHRHHS